MRVGGVLIDNWDDVGPYFTAVWEGITGTFGAAWDFIKGIMDKVAAGIGWIGEQIDKIPVLSSAARGLGKAWDWAFGDDEDEKDKPETAAPSAPAPSQPATAAPAAAMREPLGQAQQAAKPTAAEAPASSAPPTVGQAARPTPSGTAGRANVPQRAAKARPRQASSAHAPDLAQLAALSGSTISMDMHFQVQGLDAATFKQKINECRADFEAIVRRVVEDIRHQKARTAYAQ